jgi:hypothetical protein
MRTVTPVIGQAFAEWMVAENDAEGEIHRANRPEGMPVFSFSAVMDCSRKLGYKVAGLPPTDPMDGASLAITKMGSILHVDVQAAAAGRWPHARFEVLGQVGDLIWGYVDIDNPDEDEVGEIKSVGAYKFDLANGYFRQGKAHVRPEGGAGPSVSHICQGGFNAVAHGRSKVRIIYLSREAISVTKAEDMGIGPIDRFWSEWVFGPEEWMPLVTAETERLGKIRSIVDGGEIPGRQMYDDKSKKFTEPNPEKHPLCRYCPQQHRCKMDGPGRIPITPNLKLVAS